MVAGVGSRWWLDTLGVGVGTAALALLLAREELHGDDVQGFVAAVQSGRLEHPYHHLYLQVGSWMAKALEPVGVGVAIALRAASSAGVAIGAMLLHRAAAAAVRDRRWAGLAAAWCVVSPGVLYFGTVAEVHGVFMAAVGLVWAVFYGLRGSVWRAVALGGSIGVAAAVHATGHMLLGAVALARVAEGDRKGLRRGAVFLGTVAGVQLAVAAGLGRLSGPASPGPPFAATLGFLEYSWTRWGQFAGWLELPATAWREWVSPFMPVSIIAAVALFGGECRAAARLLHVLVGVYVVVASVLLWGACERGAYLLPLVFPAVLVAQPLVAARWRLPLVFGTLLWSGAIILGGDHPRQDRALGRDIAELGQRERAVLIGAGRRELDTVAVYCPEVPMLSVHSVFGMLSERRVSAVQLRQSFGQLVASLRRSGQTLWFTDGAQQALRESGDALLVAFATIDLQQEWQLEPRQLPNLLAWRVSPRQ